MKKYSVKVKKVLERIIEVEANSKQEAEDIIVEKYDSSEIILEYNDLKHTIVVAKKLNKIKIGTKIRIKNQFDCLEGNVHLKTYKTYMFHKGDMDHLCGKVFEIVYIERHQDKKFYMIRDEEDQDWYFIKKMFQVIK